MEDIGYLNIKAQTIALADPVARNTANEAKMELGNKVDKVEGKQLSENDFTSALLEKLNNIADGANKTIVEDSLTSTSTANALSAAQGKALNDGKVDKIKGMGLSANDFTSALLAKLNGIQEGAQVNASAEFDGEALRFIYPAEFTLNADDNSYTVVHSNLWTEFREAALFFFTASRWAGNTAVII